jgi:hypothetical protein
MSSHYLHNNTFERTEYLTPPFILKALGPFDLDPCAPKVRPWKIAAKHYTEDGLSKPWSGLVWLNPPYGKKNAERSWVEKLMRHGNGIALLFSKPETRLWQEVIFPATDGFLFIDRRLSFYNTDGSATQGTFGSSVLIAVGPEALKRLEKSKIQGFITYKGKESHAN